MKRINMILLIPLLFNTFASAQESTKSDDKALEKGISLVNEEKYEEALPFINEAISADKENAELYRLLGQILEMLDETEEAIEAWTLCLTLTEDEELEKEAKLHLEALEE